MGFAVKFAGFRSPLYWLALASAMFVTALASYGVAAWATAAPSADEASAPKSIEPLEIDPNRSGPKVRDTISPYKDSVSGE